MTLYGKLATRAAREHTVVSHPTHKRHVAENAERWAEDFLLVPQLPTAPKKDFSPVAKFLHEYARVGGKLVPVTSKVYLAHLALAAKPQQYQAPKMRNGKVGTTVRLCKSPLVRIEQMCSPATAEYLYQGVATNPARVAEFLNSWAQEQIPWLEAETGCRVEGYSIHVDSGIPHISWAFSRVVNNELHAANGFGLLGPWSVAVDRQRRAGVYWAAHEAKLAANLRKRASRGWTGLPFDIALARKLDELCARDLPGLIHFVSAYVQDLAARRCNAVAAEKQRLYAALASLEEAERPVSVAGVKIDNSKAKQLVK